METVEYRMLRANAVFWKSYPEFVEDQVAKAIEDGAPQDVIEYMDPDAYERSWRYDSETRVFDAGHRVWVRRRLDECDSVDYVAEMRRIMRDWLPVAGADVPEKVTEAAIFGSGMDYAWWLSYKKHFEYVGVADAPDGWRWTVTGGDDDPNEQYTVDVTHEKIMRAARAVIDPRNAHRISTLEPRRLRDECGRLVFDHDCADFDANNADDLLQVIVFGEVKYG